MVSGTEAKFRVEATGDDLQFQWQKDHDNISDYDKNYCGTDTNTLHIGMVDKGDEGRYRCLVMNYVEKVASNDADLTVGKLVLPSYMYVNMVNVCLAVRKLDHSQLLYHGSPHDQ